MLRCSSKGVRLLGRAGLGLSRSKSMAFGTTMATALVMPVFMTLVLTHQAQAQTQPPSPTRAAVPWEKVGTYEGRTLYIDPSTARRSGSRVQVFALTDLKEPNATARGRQYLSKKALLEVDCNLRTLKVLQDTWYPRRMAEGEPVFQTDGAAAGSFPVQSDSPGELFWKGACGRR